LNPPYKSSGETDRAPEVLQSAREKIEEWRAEDNEVTPHNAIGDKTPR
jgi:Integrase core domain